MINPNKIIESIIEKDLWNNQVSEFTQEEIEILKNHPELLNKLTDKEFIKKKYIYSIFMFAIFLAGISKFVEFNSIFKQGSFINDFFTNILYSISMEILGATIIAYLLEIVFEKRMTLNKNILQKIEKERKS